MDTSEAYRDFTGRLRVLIRKQPELITTTLSNIFSMRLIGNKTHGDLAEIAIAEFINQYMYDFHSVHVGKDLYRAKSQEEDIKVINEITAEEFPVSLKAYGDGPLQLSTDKNALMFPRLQREGTHIVGESRINSVLAHSAFADFGKINVLPLIYNEANKRCNIMVFDYTRVRTDTVVIHREDAGAGRKHPVYRFYDANDDYICEVRYGGAAANALQRGLWTNTKKGLKFFDSVTSGWIDYSHNPVLVKLFSHALVSTVSSHSDALTRIKEEIALLRTTSRIS